MENIKKNYLISRLFCLDFFKFSGLLWYGTLFSIFCGLCSSKIYTNDIESLFLHFKKNRPKTTIKIEQHCFEHFDFWLALKNKTQVIFFVKFLGDEILSVNGHSTQGLSHSEAIAIFKGIRTGKVNIHVARRDGNYTK